ncbi:MAG: hypothetical protein IPP64_12005 [Bacteroidetes bacterium]|nr:hypothetical protein [Bacteroidota bacterium]
MQKKDLEKKLIYVYKELKRIRREHNNLGYADLVPPIQKGWKRFFVLREDVARTSDAIIFQQIIDKINVPAYSHRKDFKKRKKQKGKKVYVDCVQQLPVIELYQLRTLKLTEKERTYFNLERRYDPKHWHLFRQVLVFKEPWRFVLKVIPNMITHVKIIDPALMKAEQEYENYLIKNNLRNKMYKILDGYAKYNSNWKKQDKMKYKSLFKTESVSKIEMEIKNY